MKTKNEIKFIETVSTKVDDLIRAIQENHDFHNCGFQDWVSANEIVEVYKEFDDDYFISEEECDNLDEIVDAAQKIESDYNAYVADNFLCVCIDKTTDNLDYFNIVLKEYFEDLND